MIQLINQQFRALYAIYNDIEKAFKELSESHSLEDYTYRLHPTKSWFVYITSSEIDYIAEDCTQLNNAFNVNINSAQTLIHFIEQLIIEYICIGFDPYRAFKLVKEDFSLTSIRFNLSESEIIPTVSLLESELTSSQPIYFQLI